MLSSVSQSARFCPGTVATDDEQALNNHCQLHEVHDYILDTTGKIDVVSRGDQQRVEKYPTNHIKNQK